LTKRTLFDDEKVAKVIHMWTHF